MENGFLTTVLGGIVVALVGGIIAFYFAGVREKQARQEEKVQTLNEHRVKTFDDMRSRVRLLGAAFLTWTEELRTLEPESLPESLPDSIEEVKIVQQSVTGLSRRVAELSEQAERIRNGMASLWEFYEGEKLYLEGTTRNIFESFAKEFERRHTSVVNALANDPTVGAQVSPEATDIEFNIMKAIPEVRSIAKEELPLAQRAVMYTGLVPVLGLLHGVKTLTGGYQRDFRRRRQEHWEELRQAVLKYLGIVNEAAERAHDWDIQAHLDAFDVEAMRLANARP